LILLVEKEADNNNASAAVWPLVEDKSKTTEIPAHASRGSRDLHMKWSTAFRTAKAIQRFFPVRIGFKRFKRLDWVRFVGSRVPARGIIRRLGIEEVEFSRLTCNNTFVERVVHLLTSISAIINFKANRS
jgi:hypothetical protein